MKTTAKILMWTASILMLYMGSLVIMYVLMNDVLVEHSFPIYKSILLLLIVGLSLWLFMLTTRIAVKEDIPVAAKTETPQENVSVEVAELKVRTLIDELSANMTDKQRIAFFLIVESCAQIRIKNENKS